MIEASFMGLVAIPAGLGLIGFIEPCSIGSSLVFIKYLEGKSRTAKLVETLLFALTRALFIGLLGVLAVLIGTVFLDLQRSAWLLLGASYVLLGLLLATGRAGGLMVSLGPSLRQLSNRGGSVGLGLLFGLNIPACAAPLLFALLAGAAASGSTNALSGFIALGVFGFALSLPLVVTVLVPGAKSLLDRLAALSGRFPVFAGLFLIGLGAWSIWFGLFATTSPDITALQS
ncbi:cytochrome c biogenesis protein CcdA [uncultured Sneathiella sp.]|jgi:cytochrome c-type biogenesis protein|uniref:cytochrome c biogenesis protein CcdA n=1 Tax=uncultured Sneathiella sp. TaxID=879315 RepID=UPI0030DA8956|tara:strand:+ start:1908 stop:2597 length:690 start_codon:yes stop_codon:yes gene_type:complete